MDVRMSTGARPMNDASMALDARSDAELLVAIAGQRDRAAFDELFRRYEKPAYNLAWNLTGNRERAAEAVQEALLRVWLRAANFRPDGTARGWILRIVVRESLRTARKRSGESMQEGYDLESHAAGAREVAGAETIVHEERLATLRSSIEHLPLGYRRILALYYGAGLTQKEIGEELNVSQRTVSAHLDESLKRLRQMLAQAGVAAAAPLLGPDALNTAFVSGQTPAPGLSGALAERIANPALEAGRTLSRKAAASVVWPLGWIVVLAALAVGGAGLWFLAGRPQAKSGAQAPVPPPRGVEEATAPDASKPAPPKPGVLGHWVFDKGPPEGFEVVRGEWTWQAPKDGMPGCMHAPERVWFVPPVKLHEGQYVKVALRFGVPNQKTGFKYDLYLTDGESIPDRKVCTLMGKSHINPREEIQIHEYVLGRYVAAVLVGDKVNFIQEYAEPLPRGPICVALVNVDLRELEIRALAEDEVPADLRDMPAAIAKIGEPERPALGGPLRRDD